MRKLLSLLLVICMLVPTGIITAYAQDETLFILQAATKFRTEHQRVTKKALWAEMQMIQAPL